MHVLALMVWSCSDPCLCYDGHVIAWMACSDASLFSDDRCCVDVCSCSDACVVLTAGSCSDAGYCSGGIFVLMHVLVLVA